jgi:endonuclease III
MQVPFSFSQKADLVSIQERLTVHFGKIRVEERPDPVSQLVGSFLGSRTYDKISWDAFMRLVGRYPSWDALADAPVADIEATLEGVIFSEKKAPELKQALCMIRARFGQIDLDFLSEHSVDKALNCLEKIHGVGRKIAAATLNFSSLRVRIFVVDAHVLRLLQRFDFVAAEASSDAVMPALDVA